MEGLKLAEVQRPGEGFHRLGFRVYGKAYGLYGGYIGIMENNMETAIILGLYCIRS